jgi:organic radical activating enzyme
MEAQRILPGSAAVKITDGCNFECGHCCFAHTRQRYDMPPDDMAILMERMGDDNPMFNRITLSGGEPRNHAQFREILATIVSHVHNAGRKLVTETKGESEEDRMLRKVRDDYLDSLPEEVMEEMKVKGELDASIISRLLKSDYVNSQTFGIHVFTNGYGMSSPEDTNEIIMNLVDQGVNHITVSQDFPHQEFARERNIAIDYDYLDELFSSCDTEALAGIPKFVSLDHGGNGHYVMPVARARDYPWPERVAMSGAGRNEFEVEEIDEIVEALKEYLGYEFDSWPEVNSHTHCYCGPAHLRRAHYRTSGFREENRVRSPGVGVEPDLCINSCGYNIVPTIGNLKDQSIQEIYEMAANTELYKILDEEGPQGLARKFTDKSEGELREEFLEWTPCGMCEDVVKEHPEEIQMMMRASE